MKEIKTVIEKRPELFDEEVNKALAEGWNLTRRDVFPGHYFLAELERDVKNTNIDYEEKNCKDCKHFYCSCRDEPCFSCGEGEHWEAKE